MSQLRTHLARYLSDEPHVRSARRLLAATHAPTAGAHEFLAEEQAAFRRWGEPWALTSFMALDGELHGDCFCGAGHVVAGPCAHLVAFARALDGALNDDSELGGCANGLERALVTRSDEHVLDQIDALLAPLTGTATHKLAWMIQLADDQLVEVRVQRLDLREDRSASKTCELTGDDLRRHLASSSRRQDREALALLRAPSRSRCSTGTLVSAGFSAACSTTVPSPRR